MSSPVVLYKYSDVIYGGQKQGFSSSQSMYDLMKHVDD